MVKATNFKYNEDGFLAELQEYITSTYNQHYVGNNDIQTIDVWDSQGIAEEACMSNVIKYVMRYGKKNGHNKKDLLKAMHYLVLVAHFTQDKWGAEQPSASAKAKAFAKAFAIGNNKED